MLIEIDCVPMPYESLQLPTQIDSIPQDTVGTALKYGGKISSDTLYRLVSTTINLI